MYTFTTVSYNHSNYIIEHLESIKYQILNYGQNRRIRYCCFDDCSKDETVSLIKKWLDKNEGLFAEVRIIENKENLGTVKNMINARSSIETEKFCVLAGDDLYYKNNVFEAESQKDFIFSPVIRLDDSGHCLKNLKEMMGNDINYYIGTKVSSSFMSRYLKRELGFGTIAAAPGVFINRRIFKDKDFIDFLTQFKLIEDYPTWYYWFVMNDCKSYKFLDKAYVLYRCSSGVSNEKSEAHKKNKTPYDNDLRLFRKEFKIYKNKYLYPNVYERFLFFKLFKKEPFSHYEEIFNGNADNYIDEIRKNASRFLKGINDKEDANDI